MHRPPSESTDSTRCNKHRKVTFCLAIAWNAWFAASFDSPTMANQVERKGWVGVGDGITDETATLQAAIDQGLSSIHFRAGSYRLTKPIDIDLDKTGPVSLTGDGAAKIVMEGPGPAFRFRGTHQGTADPKTFDEKVWERQRAPMIDGLEIVGRHAEACGIEADGTMQLTVTRLVIRRTLHAIHLVHRNRNVLIANCHLYENGGIGVFLDDVDLHQINVNACHISYNGQGGVVSKQGNVRNLHINGCDIESNMNPDMPPTANVLIDCSGSNYGTAEVSITGCTLQHNSKAKESANIRIVGHAEAKPAQPAVRWGNVAITGNVLSDVATNVHLRGCRGVTLQGNTFWMGYEHNLLVEESAHVVIGPNNLDRNPGYSYGDAAQSKNAIVFRKCEDCSVSGLHVSNVHGSQAGVLIEKSQRFNVTACTILDCDGPGLWLRQVHKSLITGCLVRDDRPDRERSVSLCLEGGEENTIAENVFAHGIETIADPLPTALQNQKP